LEHVACSQIHGRHCLAHGRLWSFWLW
jgi:hypothetical protein